MACPRSASVNVCHTHTRLTVEEFPLKCVCGKINDDLSTMTVWCCAAEASEPSEPSNLQETTTIHFFLEYLYKFWKFFLEQEKDLSRLVTLPYLTLVKYIS